MPRSTLRALALTALLAAALAALAAPPDGGEGEPRPGPRAAAGVPGPAGVPLTLCGLAFLALANRRRLAERAVAAETS